ncbi:hypothetical protein BVRB_2g034740 [Beta vulgaris subsp. vulgaris]|nr:hypothetical protein BVRB_2g034740 [Beta vulgaris subsp. vulgaris]
MSCPYSDVWDEKACWGKGPCGLGPRRPEEGRRGPGVNWAGYWHGAVAQSVVQSTVAEHGPIEATTGLETTGLGQD